MVPPEAFSMSAAQACVAATSGCAGGTQSDTFMLTVLSCARAGVTPAVSSRAKSGAKRGTRSVFLIDIISLATSGLKTLLRILLYYIIISASSAAALSGMTALKAIKVKGANGADESSHHWRRAGGIAAGPIAA